MKRNRIENHPELIIYQRKDGRGEVPVRLESDSVWLTQAQLVELYASSKANINEYIKHILKKKRWAKNQLFGIPEQLLRMARAIIRNIITFQVKTMSMAERDYLENVKAIEKEAKKDDGRRTD